jgi:hypothetical protein
LNFAIDIKNITARTARSVGGKDVVLLQLQQFDVANAQSTLIVAPTSTPVRRTLCEAAETNEAVLLRGVGVAGEEAQSLGPGGGADGEGGGDEDDDDEEEVSGDEGTRLEDGRGRLVAAKDGPNG